MKNRSVVCVWMLCAAMLLGGCSFRRLKKDLKVMDSLYPVSGVVVNESSLQKPVVVVLWAVGNSDPSGYWVVQHDGEFSFLRKSGRYYLLAYEDANEDSRYQKTEFAAAYGEPTIIDLDSGAGFQGLELRLRPPGEVVMPPSVLGTTFADVEKKFAFRTGQTGELTTMDNPLFSMDNASMGLWTPVQFVEKIGMKIYFLEPYDPTKIPVLFIHGSSGHPGLWKEIVESLDREKFQPWLTYYPSGLRLGALGGILAKYIDELHLKHQFKDLVVVAHSMGGLVGRSMIQSYAELPKPCSIPLYITLATPWQGHTGAAMGVKHAPAVIPAWYDMVPDSPFIAELFAHPFPGETQFHLLFAYRGKAGMKFSSGNTDGTVTLGSQLFMPAQEAATQVYGIDASHVGILSDTNALQMLGRIMGETARASNE